MLAVCRVGPIVSGAGNSARVDQLVGLKAPDRTPVDQLVPSGQSQAGRVTRMKNWRAGRSSSKRHPAPAKSFSHSSRVRS